MKILIANDDGIYADGIKALANSLKRLGTVVVVAPAVHYSGAGHSITTVGDIKVEKIQFDQDIEGYKVFGTPRDCVDLALKAIVKDVDLVVTGINAGPNLSSDVVCSGTVGSASAAIPYNIPSMAVSLNWNESNTYDYTVASQYAYKIAKWFINQDFKTECVLNCNIPNLPSEQIKGIKVCKFGGEAIYHQTVAPTFDGQYYYYSTKCDKITYNNYIESTEGDVYALKQGYVTITPVDTDVVKYSHIDIIKNSLDSI